MKILFLADIFVDIQNILRMNLQEKVTTIMSDKLITLHPKDKVKKARDIFDQYNIHHIPVVVMDKVVGIISQGDILYLEGVINNSFDKFIRDQRLESTNMEDIMTSNVACADVDYNIQELVKLMVKFNINAVPILKEDNLVGIVTSYDIFEHILKQ